MTGWREKRREARWKRKARMRNLERINKNKKCLAAKIIWICSRLPWRRELKCLVIACVVYSILSPSVKAWVEIAICFADQAAWLSPSVKAWVEIVLKWLLLSSRRVAFRAGVSWNDYMPKFQSPEERRLPWRRELKWGTWRVRRNRRNVAFREGVSWEY